MMLYNVYCVYNQPVHRCWIACHGVTIRMSMCKFLRIPDPGEILLL